MKTVYQTQLVVRSNADAGVSTITFEGGTIIAEPRGAMIGIIVLPRHIDVEMQHSVAGVR